MRPDLCSLLNTRILGKLFTLMDKNLGIEFEYPVAFDIFLCIFSQRI